MPNEAAFAESIIAPFICISKTVSPILKLVASSTVRLLSQGFKANIGVYELMIMLLPDGGITAQESAINVQFGFVLLMLAPPFNVPFHAALPCLFNKLSNV